jgi:hypothetical protein
MTTQIADSRNTFLPNQRCLTPDGQVLIVNGIDAAKIHKGQDTTLYNAGMPLAVNSTFAGTWGTAGAITGTYYYAFRYIDADGIPGDLSVLQSAVAATHSTISYANVPVSSDARVAGRQIFRSLAGENTVLYLDATISDNSTTSTTSTKSDATLATQTELHILAPDGSIFARRFGVPVSWMRNVVYHNNRTFWFVAAKYTEGHAAITNGSATVTIVGGTVTDAMDGRQFVIPGHATSYTIDSVSTGSNTLTLATTFTGTTNLFSLYSVQPAKDEFRRVRWSYPGEPESCYDNDSADLESDQSAGEELIGGFSFNSFMWLLTPNAAYRWSFADNPVAGQIYHTEDRGMLNPRSYCRFENTLAIMDRAGIYLFNGGNANPISNVISDWLRDNVVWDRQEWFHASAYPAEETVKFFVCLDGSRYPRHSVCFNYRTLRWWWEEYPWEIASSATVPIAGKREIIYGGECDRTTMHGRFADIPTDDRDLSARYAVASATPMSCTVTADWAAESYLIGSAIAVVAGKGKGQIRRIYKANATSGRIEIDRPWTTSLDTTSYVALGAVHWMLQTKVFETLADTQQKAAVGVYVDPTDNAASFDVKLYYNHRQTAVLSERSYDSQRGLKVFKDRADIECQIARTQDNKEFDGWHDFPIEAGFESGRHAKARYQQFGVEGFQSRDRIVVHGIDVTGVAG